MNKHLKSVPAMEVELPFKVNHQAIGRRIAREGRFTYHRLKKKIFHTANHKVKRVSGLQLWQMERPI